MPSKLSNHKLKPKTLLCFEALGTPWEIVVQGGIDARLESAVFATLEEIDKMWSRFRPDSMVAEMARTAGTYSLNTADRALLAWYHTLYQATSGSVTPLIGQTLADAGYDALYSLRPKSTIAVSLAWEERLQLGTNSVDILQPCLLDVGAAGKGFAVDQVAALLKGPYVVDAGGDMRINALPQIIGLEDPLDPERVIGTCEVTSGSLCGSASNRRSWDGGKWHHVVDPHRSLPVTAIAATWVLAENAMLADGLATALFFVPPERLASLARFDYVVLHADGSVLQSDNSALRVFAA